MEIFHAASQGRYASLVMEDKHGFTVELYSGDNCNPYCTRHFDDLGEAMDFANTFGERTTALIPALLAEFRDNIRIFKGLPKTDETVKAASALIDQYAGRLQLLDVTMSQADARATLRGVYLTL